MASRAMWSGTISFGLVNVPVKMFPAVKDRDIHFHLLSKDGTCRLRRKLFCPETGDEFGYKDTARGIEVAPDQYVIVTDEELESIKPQAARTINIIHFVDLEEIDPIYYERAYYLAPDEHGATAYVLLLEAMKRANRVGIAKFVMRGKEYLAAIRPLENGLYLETMNFADEVVKPDELPLPKDVEVDRKQLEAANKLIDALEAEFNADQYRPEYRQRLAKLIDRKAAGEEIVTHEPAAEAAPTMNLMKALQASLAEAKRESTRRPRRRKSA
ncbi:MAG: Ku protein [Phycisphaerales bacterium]|nr:Ku protein [Phycisphaerales bacterium]